MPDSSTRVLVVDDNADIARLMAVLVRHCGHDVRMAHDAATSIDIARDYRPDVVFLDIGLPDLDGYELVKQLRREPGLEETLFVALTGYSADSDRELSQQSGFHFHVVKPITLETLQKILSQRN